MVFSNIESNRTVPNRNFCADNLLSKISEPQTPTKSRIALDKSQTATAAVVTLISIPAIVQPQTPKGPSICQARCQKFWSQSTCSVRSHNNSTVRTLIMWTAQDQPLVVTLNVSHFREICTTGRALSANFQIHRVCRQPQCTHNLALQVCK